MNDHHLDPPDYPEPPEWYYNLESALEDEDVPESVAAAVRRALDDWAQDQACEQDPPEQVFDEVHTCAGCGKPTECVYCSDICTPDCPHGNRPGGCDACDHISDLAHDAARESR